MINIQKIDLSKISSDEIKYINRIARKAKKKNILCAIDKEIKIYQNKKVSTPYNIVSNSKEYISPKQCNLLLNDKFAFFVETFLKSRDVNNILKKDIKDGSSYYDYNFNKSIFTIIHNVFNKIKLSDSLEEILRNTYNLIKSLTLSYLNREVILLEIQFIIERFFKNLEKYLEGNKILYSDYNLSQKMTIEGVKIISQIDRIDFLEDGTVNMIIYKTGSIESTLSMKTGKSISTGLQIYPFLEKYRINKLIFWPLKREAQIKEIKCCYESIAKIAIDSLKENLNNNNANEVESKYKILKKAFNG